MNQVEHAYSVLLSLITADVDFNIAMQSSRVQKFLYASRMDTYVHIMIITIILTCTILRVVLCLTAVQMVTFFLEIIREHVKLMEHGLVTSHNVVSCCVVYNYFTSKCLL